MKKTLSMLLAGLMLASLLASCGGDDAATTTTGSTTTASTTTTATTTTAATTTTEKTEEPDAPKVYDNLEWYDNNGDQGTYYVITEGENGGVDVVYAMESYDDAAAHYGYEGWSWVNMAADISNEFNETHTTFVLVVQGTAGETILVKPLDCQPLEKTVTFDGSVQTITFDVTNVTGDNAPYIIIFGAGGKPDAAGEFTIYGAYFE